MGKWSLAGTGGIQQPEGFCRKKKKQVSSQSCDITSQFLLDAAGRTDGRHTHYVANSRKPHSYRYYYPTTKLHHAELMQHRVVLGQLIESTEEAPKLVLLNCLEKYLNVIKKKLKRCRNSNRLCRKKKIGTFSHFREWCNNKNL
jgi:hypothetical protein